MTPKQHCDIFVASVPDGHGARHLAFCEKGNFALSVNELKSTLTLFKYRDGCFEPLSTVSALPEEYKGISEAAAIRWEKDGIFVSNRGANSVTEFKFDGKALSLVRSIPSYGNRPRDIYIKDNFIFAANERSDNLSIIHKESGQLLNSVNIIAPLCVLAI